MAALWFSLFLGGLACITAGALLTSHRSLAWVGARLGLIIGGFIAAAIPFNEVMESGNHALVLAAAGAGGLMLCLVRLRLAGNQTALSGGGEAERWWRARTTPHARPRNPFDR
jgi:hypothetical protein